MRKSKSAVLFLFAQCIFFFSTTLITSAADETLTPSTTPKPIDPGKVDRAMEFFNKGNEYAEKGLKERAREYWKIASELDPRLSENGNGSGFLFFGLEEVSETTFRTTDPAKQKRILEFLSKARLADKENDYDSAMKFLDLADDFSPNEPQVRALRIGLTLEDFKEDQEDQSNPLAKNYFDESVEYYRHGKFTEALESLNQAEELEPQNLQILNLKSIIQEDDASVLLSKDVQRAREQWEEGNAEISVEILNGVLKENSQYQPALDLQAEMGKSQETEMLSEIQATLAQAVKEESDDNFSEAKKNYERVLDLDPNNKIASAALDRVADLVDPLPEKIKLFEKALAAGQKRKAMVFLKEIKTLSPNNPKLAYWKERISELSGNSVTENDESKADEAYNLGLESYRNGNLTDAKKFWSQSLELNPQHLQAKRDLDRLLDEHPELK